MGKVKQNYSLPLIYEHACLMAVGKLLIHIIFNHHNSAEVRESTKWVVIIPWLGQSVVRVKLL